MTVGFVCWITIINLMYLLMQIVIAAEDCSVAKAWRHPPFAAEIRDAGDARVNLHGVTISAQD